MSRSSKENHVFLSNGLTSALENNGVIDWFPCPRFDSPSVFSSILDDSKGGYFSVRPTEAYRLKTGYLNKSLVVRNLFETRDGRLEVTDFLPINSVAIMRGFKSEVPFLVDVRPAFGYGKSRPIVEAVGDRLVFRDPESQKALELYIKGRYTLTKNKIAVEPGEGHLSLRYMGREFVDATRSRYNYKKALNTALDYYGSKISYQKISREFRDAQIRSLLVILGLIYRSEGSIIAASTTSLPEVIGGVRNWDYRYVWIRDAAYACEALVGSNLLTEARRILEFIIRVAKPKGKTFLHPLYSVDGRTPEKEKVLGWLGGYRGSVPVRTGNAAFYQMQMDLEGGFMDSLYSYYKKSNDRGFVTRNWWVIEAIARWVGRSWQEPCISLWEERYGKRHFVHSKLMNWVAMDRAYELGRKLGIDAHIKDWSEVRDRIREEIIKYGVSNGSFTQYYGSDEIDSSLLLLPIYGLIDIRSQTFISTLRRIESELKVKNGMILRSRKSFPGKAVHPFILSNAWLCRVYIRLGMMRNAKRLIKKIIDYSTSLNLLGEHVDIKTREPRGNFPQLISHAGLVSAILDYENARRRS